MFVPSICLRGSAINLTFPKMIIRITQGDASRGGAACSGFFKHRKEA